MDTLVASESTKKILHHLKDFPRLKYSEKFTELKETQCDDDINILKYYSQ